MGDVTDSLDSISNKTKPPARETRLADFSMPDVSDFIEAPVVCCIAFGYISGRYLLSTM